MRRSALTLAVVGCLTVASVVACSSNVPGNGTAAGSAAVDALPSDNALPSTDAFPSADALPSTDTLPSGSVPSGSGGSDTAGAPSTSGAQSSSTVAQPAPVTQTATAPKTATVTHPPASPAFQSLTLQTGSPACNAAGGPTTEPEILTWRVSNATGVAVGIDDTNFGDASGYPGASGSQELTNIQCSGSVKYTFDVWTTGGSGGVRAHKQLQVTGPSGVAPATPPSFQQLALSTGTPSCAPQAGVTTVPEILSWRVANATGIAVGIDDSNFADASQYSGASGGQAITNIACSGSVKYTFDIWTIGGSGGAQAHQQLTTTGPA